MNNKGFAISIILYSMIFLLIAIFYILLGIVRTRYIVNNKLRESVMEELNSAGILGDKIIKLCNNENVEYVQKYNVTTNGAAIDTPDGSGDAYVCYYTSNTSDNLAGKNGNVIFGNYCWQIVRTTTDGGVKLLYNGLKTDDDKCPNDNSKRPSSTVMVQYDNTSQYSATDVGLSGARLYSKDFEIIDDNGTKKFKLIDTFTAKWDGDYNGDGKQDRYSIIGNYTCDNSGEICSNLYYVQHVSTSSISSNSAEVAKYKITNNSYYYLIGFSSFNNFDNILSQAGYMYNDNCTYSSRNFPRSHQYLLSEISIAPSLYYYGDKAIWNSSTNKYELKIDDGNGNYITPTSTSNWQNIQNNAIGKYTCLSGTATSCDKVYYIATNSTSGSANAIPLSNNESIDDIKITWSYGNDYTINGTSYTITDPQTTTFLLKDWPTIYNNSEFKKKYVCADFASTTCDELHYITESYNNRIYYYSSNNKVVFGNSVSYQDGHYVINTSDDSTMYQQLWDWNKNRDIHNSHYTCFKTNTNDCDDVIYYVFFVSDSQMLTMSLYDGDTIEIALNKMLNVDNSITSDINKYNSAVKVVIDKWYENNLAYLSSYIDDDAVFCNNRAVASFGGFRSTNATSNLFLFKAKGAYPNPIPTLSCENNTDRFSKNNVGIAELKYPIGLLSSDESSLMKKDYASASTKYWIGSPNTFDKYVVYNYLPGPKSNTSSTYFYNSAGIRPAIVLKPGVTVTGIGTYDDPYIVETGS